MRKQLRRDLLDHWRCVYLLTYTSLPIQYINASSIGCYAWRLGIWWALMTGEYYSKMNVKYNSKSSRRIPNIEETNLTCLTELNEQKRCTFTTRKLCYRKDDRAMRPTYECPEYFRDSLTTPTALLPTFSWAFLPIDPMNVPTKFEVRSFTRSWDNRGYPKNLGSPWIRPRSLFSKIFNGFLLGLAL